MTPILKNAPHPIRVINATATNTELFSSNSHIDWDDVIYNDKVWYSLYLIRFINREEYFWETQSQHPDQMSAHAEDVALAALCPTFSQISILLHAHGSFYDQDFIYASEPLHISRDTSLRTSDTFKVSYSVFAKLIRGILYSKLKDHPELQHQNLGEINIKVRVCYSISFLEREFRNYHRPNMIIRNSFIGKLGHAICFGNRQETKPIIMPCRILGNLYSVAKRVPNISTGQRRRGYSQTLPWAQYAVKCFQHGEEIISELNYLPEHELINLNLSHEDISQINISLEKKISDVHGLLTQQDAILISYVPQENSFLIYKKNQSGVVTFLQAGALESLINLSGFQLYVVRPIWETLYSLRPSEPKDWMEGNTVRQVDIHWLLLLETVSVILSNPLSVFCATEGSKSLMRTALPRCRELFYSVNELSRNNLVARSLLPRIQESIDLLASRLHSQSENKYESEREKEQFKWQKYISKRDDDI